MDEIRSSARFLAIGLLALGVALISQGALGQEEQNPRVRSQYTNENAPPYARFVVFMNKIGLSSQPDSARLARYLVSMGFHQSDAPQLIEYFDGLFSEVYAEIADAKFRIACNDEAANLTGYDIRSLYNSFDDLKYAIHAKYLAIASAKLVAYGYPEFELMLNAIPSGFTITSIDHRSRWGETDTDIQQNRSSMCERPKNRAAK